MYYYEIGYYSYEDSHYETLTHSSKYSKDEIEDMIAEGFKSLFPSACMQEWTRIYCFYIYDSISIYDWLIVNKGFKKLEYAAVSSIFGWGDIKDENSFKKDKGVDSLYKKIIEAIDSIESDAQKPKPIMATTIRAADLIWLESENKSEGE